MPHLSQGNNRGLVQVTCAWIYKAGREYLSMQEEGTEG